MQDKAEHQHLKQFVLDYEQREEEEELKGTHSAPLIDVSLTLRISAHETRNRPIKIRLAG
jgi:hypothetical protein